MITRGNDEIHVSDGSDINPALNEAIIIAKRSPSVEECINNMCYRKDAAELRNEQDTRRILERARELKKEIGVKEEAERGEER